MVNQHRWTLPLALFYRFRLGCAHNSSADGIIEVPVERLVERVIHVPVEHITEKLVEVPRIVTRQSAHAVCSYPPRLWMVRCHTSGWEVPPH